MKTWANLKTIEQYRLMKEFIETGGIFSKFLKTKNINNCFFYMETTKESSEDITMRQKENDDTDEQIEICELMGTKATLHNCLKIAISDFIKDLRNLDEINVEQSELVKFSNFIKTYYPMNSSGIPFKKVIELYLGKTRQD